jgi:hypothetical protein
MNTFLFPALCMLIFGLYPFSYEAVLWAAAVNHVLMLTYGLASVLLYLSGRNRVLRHQSGLLCFILSGLALIAACLSHEMGYIFGLILLLVELAYAYVERRRPQVAAILLVGVDIAYALLYQTVVHTVWSSGGIQGVIANAGSWPQNILIHVQGIVAWFVVLVRHIIGLPQPREWIVVAIFVTAIGIALFVLWREKRMQLGAFALAWWLVTLLPSAIWLNNVYLGRGPRFLYEPAVGVALFWAAVVTCALRLFKPPVLKAVLAACIGVGLIWSAGYISEQRDEIARLTPALNIIDTDLRQSAPDAKVLLINIPYWNMPAQPSFMVGVQGMQFFQQGNDPMKSWLASVSGVSRRIDSVRHDISLTHGDRYDYGIPGDTVNDTVLREKLLAANYIYRFDYDAPGLRARRLAIVQNDTSPSTDVLVTFSQGAAQASVRSASAIQCQGVLKASLVWTGVGSMTNPTGVFVHGFDAQNNQVAVADRDLIDGYLPLERVPAGVAITETRIITAAPGTTPVTQLRIGLYNRVNGERFTARRADGATWEGGEVVVAVQPESESCDP